MELSNTLSHFRSQRLGHITKFEIQAWFATLLVLFFGVVASVLTDQWHWFSRAGSVLVLIGVIAAWADLSGKFNSIKEKGLYEYLDYVSEVKGIPKEEVEADKEMFEQHSNLTIARVRKVEFINIALGTFIWGFGDLIGLINNA